MICFLVKSISLLLVKSNWSSNSLILYMLSLLIFTTSSLFSAISVKMNSFYFFKFSKLNAFMNYFTFSIFYEPLFFIIISLYYLYHFWYSLYLNWKRLFLAFISVFNLLSRWSVACGYLFWTCILLYSLFITDWYFIN